MFDYAIKIEGLSKKYALGGTHTLTIADWVRSLKSNKRASKEEFWALQDINLELNKGEAVGVIGKNGAGKSTLLKILSKITYPTTGRFEMHGRVSSLLEVGTGFHPELSGQENIYLNGTILGMSRKEIKAKLDEIVDFSGVSKFINTPVKHYSSGMYVRLAFSVAAHLEPEILIIDEVLAVGDSEFQKKCLGKMDEVAQQGRTVLFVSHNMGAVAALTKSSVLLEKGKIRAIGESNDVIAKYLVPKTADSFYRSDQKVDHPSVREVRVITSESGEIHRFGADLKISFEICSPVDIRGACLSFQVVRSDETPIIHNWIFDAEKPFMRKKGRYLVACLIPSCNLYMGEYNLNVFFTDGSGSEVYTKLEGVCRFQVEMFSKVRTPFPFKHGSCTYINDFTWKIDELAEN